MSIASCSHRSVTTSLFYGKVATHIFLFASTREAVPDVAFRLFVSLFF